MDLQEAQDAWDNVKEVVPSFKNDNDVGNGDTAEDVGPLETKLVTAQAALAHIRERVTEMPTVRFCTFQFKCNLCKELYHRLRR